MIVTVQETIEHSADITAEMVVAYALRNGWTQVAVSQFGVTLERGANDPNEFTVWRDGHQLAFRVARIADAIGRKPHIVLADIAEGR